MKISDNVLKNGSGHGYNGSLSLGWRESHTLPEYQKNDVMTRALRSGLINPAKESQLSRCFFKHNWQQDA
ncbi:hypothetical protein Xvie_02851 [Xenorhabdus vietnamensis]|uniref:Uncharacterized protein n=1 Tax=Xenorhabdus vietnamensis TaxID=351656 RepID=A0A1Y2SCU5_9GAMM|nr:hypothetical protein [Xenorhabdus vietnamensis]OTA15353.1 hypothetical protein Xvie_02851 [Xenorhabdus vietnamensis]